ncbi:2Fe-2S iron-sulfur cluster-binding protein [Kineosporia succinea]|uniref:Ferredoxin-NADP reductase/predicted pyridoxine 5'-phosphate oxidase superfamily flavin-nucleotide-binding protein n=1 Tax=Kineosporia succinea TaxID=84632 RepID=A0ABT9PDJ9_9ACTN|nr:2Fe-2S iron-sulfur cluster-binding protein [Kineosporia succinea]MDP9830060.1 ferredoxin-NADP reductase/predicted pyridoxine 5'-phosphate oxidase superfamily flavin-nucleotide-binding protein [Kineosporia succinea]
MGVSTAQEIENLLGAPMSAVMLKQIDHVDRATAPVLGQSPVAALGYQDEDGVRRSTLVGGRAGFLEVLSPRRLALTLPSAQARPAPGGGASLVVLFPGVSEVLRLNGTVREHDGSRAVVTVEEMFVHCARAIGRARLWHPPASSRRPVLRGDITDGPLKDPAVQSFLAVAPFLFLSSGDDAGRSDTSPRGDRPGFVQILDGRTVAIPDRRGNRRADTLHNVLQDDRVALAVLVPGRPQVLHVHGRATISTDPELLNGMALRGMSPHAALVVDVGQAWLADSEPVREARLWSPDAHLDAGRMVDLNVLATGHLAANPAVRGGPLIRSLGYLLGRFPALTRRLMGRQTGAALEKEGYLALEAAPRVRRLKVTALRRETPDAITVVLSDGAPVDFTPGQFFTVSVEVGGRTLRRAYSASSVPGATALEITVKRVEGGAFSGHVHAKLRTGDAVDVRGPSGSLFGDAGAGELVMIAAGSGITPMMSMIRSGSARMHLLYGNRDEAGIIFDRELTRSSRVDVTHQLTRPGPGWKGRTGRITAGSLSDWLDHVRPSPEARYHLCGPDTMMEAGRETLLARGVAAERIRLESYTSAVDGTSGPASGAAHRMQVSDGGAPVGTVEVAPGETLLDAGLAAGLPMPYSCTVGNCGECVVKLLGGRVRMNEPNCLPGSQRADGYVLTCVGRPESEVSLDIADLA